MFCRCLCNIYSQKSQLVDGGQILSCISLTLLGETVCLDFNYFLPNSCDIYCNLNHARSVRQAAFFPAHMPNRRLLAWQISFRGLMIVISKGFTPPLPLTIAWTMVMWWSSQWIEEFIEQRASKRNPRKALIGVLACAITEIILKIVLNSIN